MANRDGALPVEGNDSSSHSEARSYSFDTIGQVLVQLAYNLQERRYGGGRGGPRGEEGGYEDMLPLSEQLRGSESSLPSYTSLSPPGRIDQPRQVCHIGERRRQPGGSRTPPAVQGVRTEERYEPLSEQTVEERRNERRQEGGQEERDHRRGEYIRRSTRREEGKTGTTILMIARQRIGEGMATVTEGTSMITIILGGKKVGFMNPNTIEKRSVGAIRPIMMGINSSILDKESVRTRGHTLEGRHFLCPHHFWRIKMQGGSITSTFNNSRCPLPGKRCRVRAGAP